MVQRVQPIALTYSRVSNPNDRREASLESQEEAQVALLKSRGYHVPPELRFRERFTGMDSIYDRPVLCQIRDLIANGRVQAMSAYDTDRLARNGRELLTIVADNHKRGVQTLFVKCDHDTEGRIGELILYMKGFASALEWDAILDRTTRGRQKILQKGQWVGGGTPKYGYIFNREDRSRTANPETAPIVRRILDQMARGVSLQQIAGQLTLDGVPTPFAYAGRAPATAVWWPTTVRGIIRDRTYIGDVAARRYAADGPRGANGRRRMRRRPAEEHLKLTDHRTEALIEPEQFARANAVMAQFRTKKGRPQRERSMLLSGLTFCGHCGCRLTPQTVHKRHKRGEDRYGPRYQVKVYRCMSTRLKDGPDCGRTFYGGWVEAAAWAIVAEKILKPGFMERESKKLAKNDGGDRLRTDLKSSQERRRKIDKQVKQLIECQLENADSKVLASALKDKLRDLDRMAEDLDQHIAELSLRIEAAGKQRRIIEIFMASIEQIRERTRNNLMDRLEKQKIFDLLSARVYAWREEDGRRRVRVEVPIGTWYGRPDETPGCST